MTLPPVDHERFIAEVRAASTDAEAELRAATSRDAVEAVRVKFLGRADGVFTKRLASELPRIQGDGKRAAGAEFNRVRGDLQQAIDARLAHFAAESKAAASAIADRTMPARHPWVGSVHPVSQVIDDVIEIFRELGFSVALGPEVESSWYNFGSLNFRADHPAMDVHDTLYLAGDHLLRTHTSPVQVRTLQSYPPPIRVLIPGNVHRRDPFDASHAPTFAQIEGLVVDEGITFADLKATLNHFASRFFGATKTRFRPSHFPFTEPSAEMDVQCGVCRGAGCGTCKQSGWIEILGSGLVHPAVLESAGVDSAKYSGWAFGMGPARTALARHGIPDIRLLYDSDVRFLAQFGAQGSGGAR